VSSASVMGKPVTADLKLGLATAPVLFAADQVRSSSSAEKYVFVIIILSVNRPSVLLHCWLGVFLHAGFPQLMLHCVLRKLGYLRNKGTYLLNFV